MRNTVISPRFEEEAYKGQDVVHQGIRIPLHGMLIAEVLRRFSRRAQRICDQKSDVWFRPMLDQDLRPLRRFWFDPQDPTFPTTLDAHCGVTAMLGDEIVGGAIWSPQGRNLFLHQLVAGEKGKELQVPTRLIWASVQEFWIKYHSLDIGVSYNPHRYEFFKNFAVETYPIILKKPFYVPVIRLSPFRSIPDLQYAPDHEVGMWKDEAITFFPRASYALYGVLKHLGIGYEDDVCIVKTFPTGFISGCVTSTIEKVAGKWVMGELTDNTKAVVVVHEFGVPVADEYNLQLLEQARARGIPVIEDCAWRLSKVFDWSDYAIISLQKMLNLNYGGVLQGVHLDDEFLWSIGCLDAVKRDRLRYEVEQDGGVKRREDNWYLYDNLVQADGMTPDERVNWREQIMDGWVPTVYMQRFETEEQADAIVERLEEFGIQAGRYWGDAVVYLPIHQNMSEEEVEYMFAVVRGYFNLCRDYAKA